MSICPENEYRNSLSDSEFWNYVLNDSIVQNFSEEDIMDSVALMLEKPCSICGESGPCGYDSEGRPMIHTEEDEEDEDKTP